MPSLYHPIQRDKIVLRQSLIVQKTVAGLWLFAQFAAKIAIFINQLTNDYPAIE